MRENSRFGHWLPDWNTDPNGEVSALDALSMNRRTALWWRPTGVTPGLVGDPEAICATWCFEAPDS